MLIPAHPRQPAVAATPPSAGGLESFQEIGVIVYRRTGEDFSRVEGTFALPMYRGALALELLEKTEGPKDNYHGVYDMVTKTAEGSGFPDVAATGTLTITPMDEHAKPHADGLCGSSHWVLWDFKPESWLNEACGYASTGIRQQYVGVGIEIAGVESPRLAAAWTNNVFSRTWSFKGQDMIQYGVCGSAIPAPKG